MIEYLLFLLAFAALVALFGLLMVGILFVLDYTQRLIRFRRERQRAAKDIEALTVGFGRALLPVFENLLVQISDILPETDEEIQE